MCGFTCFSFRGTTKKEEKKEKKRKEKEKEKERKKERKKEKYRKNLFFFYLLLFFFYLLLMSNFQMFKHYKLQIHYICAKLQLARDAYRRLNC